MILLGVAVVFSSIRIEFIIIPFGFSIRAKKSETEIIAELMVIKTIKASVLAT